MSLKLQFGKAAGKGRAILFAAGIATAAVTSAFLCGGCGNLLNPDNKKSTEDTGSQEAPADSGLVGDWAAVEYSSVRDGKSEVEKIPDNRKMFYSFKSSNDLEIAYFGKAGDFWIEESTHEVGKYHIKDSSICVIVDGEDDCTPFNISGNNLSLTGETCRDSGDGKSECYPYTMTFVKSSIATFKSSLGNNLKSQDPELRGTEWMKPSESGYGWELDQIGFWGSHYYDSRNVYISDSYDAAWYTERGSRLILLGLKCVEYRVYVDEWGDENKECVSQSVSQTVSLEYSLSSNGRLRIRPAGDTGSYDVWTPYDYATVPCYNGSTAECCEAYPDYPGCYHAACLANPTPGCPNYITYTLTVNINLADGGYVSTDPTMQAYRAGDTVALTAVALDGYEFSHWSGAVPSSESSDPAIRVIMNLNLTLTAHFRLIVVDPCVANPTPDCPNYCNAYPLAPECCPSTQAGCPGYDPCVANPTLGCPNYCTLYPTAPGCPGDVDPCVANPTPGCPNYCNVYPFAPECCPSTQAGCPGYDPCATNPTPDCPNYCQFYPSASGCPTGTNCYWPAGGCVPIGGAGCEDAACSESACVAAFGMVIDDCNNPPATEYCRWNGECYLLTNPDALDEENPSMTRRQTCEAYGEGGVHSSKAACEAYVPSAEYYCGWPGTGCFKIVDPDAVSPEYGDIGMTNLEVCATWGYLINDKAACDAWVPPAVQEFCNWGPCVGGNGWSCESAGCYPLTPCEASGGPCYSLTPQQHCEAGGGTIVTSCPAGTKPPDANY